MRKLKLFLDAKAANTPPRGISKASRVIFSVLTLLFLSVGNVWAAETVYTGTVAKVDANGDQVMSDVTWTITSDNTAGLGQNVNATKGAQIGSGSKPTKSLTFETTGLAGAIKKVVVNTSGASGFSGTVSVTVGSTAFQCNSSETANLSTTATDYTFEGNASGKITISWAQTTSKAIYVKTIQVTYESEESGDEPGGGDEPTPGDEPGDDPAPSSSNWIKVEPGDLATNDVVVIVENDSKAMSNDKGTSAAPAAVAVTVSEDKLSEAPAENIKWTVTVSNGSFVFATGDNHLYCTNTNNGVRVGTNANSAFTISEEGYLYNTATSRYVGVYNNSDWRCYGSINSNISGQTFSFFKESDGSTPQKQAAGLAYAEADQKKLVKLGDTFTAPTLDNPNNLTGITYASNNTDVAEVAANGAVTIKAAGVATITASFAGNDDYKAGSASYTIGVTTHAGTEADPYVAADAKIAIDAMGTVENAYATGIVSNVVTTTLPQEGYITFYFSADGATTGQQIEAYKCYGLNSAAFEAVSDVETGATVVVTGNLKKYNSTYEFDANCHLVSYEAPEVPKTHITNDQANPYTVAQAITFAADGVTYDLDDYVYVQGVVYDVKSFNNGAMNIFIKDAGESNQFELYKCAGINDGSATTPFEALSDVQVGNIVIGYGQLTVFNTTYEFKQGNYLVDLQKPATGVQLDATAEVEEESTVNLTATILPSNATGTIVWSVESGSDKASVENGVVTGIAEGTAVVRATVQGTTIYAECTVTVTAAVAPASYDYALVTDAAQLQDGLKVIIVAAEADKAAGSAAATYRNVVDVERTSEGDYLILDSENMPTEFTLGVPAAGQYTLNDGDGYMYESAAKSVKVQADPFNWSITIGEGNIATIQATNELRYNSTNPRFTTYASGQQALQLYVKNDGKQAAGLAWSANAVELTVGDEFTAPTLNNPNSIAISAITIASDNTDLAVVNDGVVSLVSEATGTATITATFAGDDTYRAASVSYTITVNAAEPPAPVSYDYALVTDAAQLQDGLKVIIVAAEADKAAGSAAATYRNVVDVERTSEGDYLILDSENMPTEFTLGVPAAGQYTFNDGDGYMYESAAKSVKVQADPFNWTITIGEGYIATIQATNELRYNSTNPRFTTYASGQQALQLYVKNDGKQAAGLAWSANAVELTVGDEFTAPTLNNPNSIAASAITIASDNTDLAVVNDGVVSLVSEATGTATITATFAGDDTYRAASVSYTITVNAAPTPAETKNVVIIAEYNSKFYAMTNSLTSGALAGVEVEKDGSKIVVFSAEDKAAIQWTATVDGDNTTLKDAENNYIKGSSGASLSLEADPYNWNWDGEKSCYISSAYTNRGLFFNSANNVFKGYALSNITSDGYAATEVIEIDPEDIVISSKVDPELAYDPEELEIEAADIASWSAPVLGYATGFDGLAAIEYGSNNESVATVTEGGEISLAGGYGTAVITATFGGNTNYLAGSATYTITVNAPAPTPTGTTYTKVTSTGEITDGEYLIVYETTSVAFNGALETLDAEGNSVAVVINEGVIAGTTAIDAAVFTIDVTAGTLQSASGKYIGVSSNSNGLKQTEDASTYTHTFSIDGEGNAVILANFEESTMKLRYNPSTSAGNLRFRYYKNDGQQAIQLYKKETPEPTYTEVRNGLTEGWYYTMCLDKAVTAVQGGTIWRVLSKAENGTDVILEEVTGTLEAGRPYIFYATADILEVVYAGSAVIEPVDDEANHGLKGSFIQTKITQSDDNYIIYNNALYFVNSDNVYVGANRAYLDMTGVPAYSNEPQQGAPRRRVVMAVNGQNGATGFENINATEKPMKLMIDGKIYILRGEKMFDATGRLVK